MPKQKTEEIPAPKQLDVHFFSAEETQKATADAREFRSGSRGFGFYGKITFAGRKYQVSLNIIEIGSKPE